jgi:poly-gamma-glutamate synthesis protein (capsule biosynthesis protein)
MKFAATGDFLIHVQMPPKHEGIDAIAAYMSDADVRVTNLETTITEGECYANAYYPDASLTAPP